MFAELIWCTTLLCYLEFLVDMQDIGLCSVVS
jgi:hypothetical protein